MELSVLGRARAELRFPPFRARLPWWGPDLQTLRNRIAGAGFRRRSLGRSTLLRLPLEDGTGDVLSAFLDVPDPPTDRPLVVLIHGLTGAGDSAAIETAAALHVGAGFPVLRPSLRGAGPSRPLCRFQYHAGRTGDLRLLLEAIRRQGWTRDLFLVGYSLGGNMLLKFLAEVGCCSGILGAAAISAPLDLERSMERFLAPRNWAYQRLFLHELKREALAPAAALSPRERTFILAARNVREFDAGFMAPRNGYRSVEEYYRANSAGPRLHAIRLPTLIVHSLDDPWIPGELYRDYPWQRNPWLFPLLVSGGGHVGFHDRSSPIAWHERCVQMFVQQLLNGVPVRLTREEARDTDSGSARPTA